MLLVSYTNPKDSYSYNGEDVTRPVTRVDLRAKGQTGVTHQNGKDIIFTLRSDASIPLVRDWQLGLRADAPVELYYSPGHNANHMADSLFQAFFITPTYDKWTFGVGAKAIFPTGGKNLSIGQGKYQILPSVAFKYDLSELSAGTYVGSIVRHAWSVAGYGSAPFISQTYIQPFFNFNLPSDWFLNSSPEMIYNWITGDWFVPFDLMIGKMVTKKIVLSLEYETALVYDYPKYRTQLEFRIGVFF